jgi:hypothetical protein
MDRRLVITISALVLALAALTAAGAFSPAGAPAAGSVADLPQPQPCAMTERPQALSVLSGDASVAWQPLAPGGMSGEFADTRYASAGAHAAPSVYVPSDRWRFTVGHPHRATHAHRSGVPAC